MNKPTIQPARAKRRAFKVKASLTPLVKAVGEHIDRRTAEAETHLAGTLERLKAYRRGDPGFEQDLAASLRLKPATENATRWRALFTPSCRPRRRQRPPGKSRPTKAVPALKRVR
jgi:hypothetical protein